MCVRSMVCLLNRAKENRRPLPSQASTDYQRWFNRYKTYYSHNFEFLWTSLSWIRHLNRSVQSHSDDRNTIKSLHITQRNSRSCRNVPQQLTGEKRSIYILKVSCNEVINMFVILGRLQSNSPKRLSQGENKQPICSRRSWPEYNHSDESFNL